MVDIMPTRGFRSHGTSPHLFYFSHNPPQVRPLLPLHPIPVICTVHPFLPIAPFVPFLRHTELGSAARIHRCSARTARSSQQRLGVSILESLCAADLNRARLCIAGPNLRHMRTLWPSKRCMPRLRELSATPVRLQNSCALTLWIFCSYLPRLPQVRRRLLMFCHSSSHSQPLLHAQPSPFQSRL
jgi:hypothetical protein